MLPIHTILFSTDFSTVADQAFRVACGVAEDYGARLVLLHVHEPPVPMGELVSLEPPHIRQTLLGDLQALQSPPSVPTEYRLEEGAVADAILRVASEIDCDLIVIGTHGRKGVGRFVLGSIAEKVLRDAPCLVLTVKGGAAKIPG